MCISRDQVVIIVLRVDEVRLKRPDFGTYAAFASLIRRKRLRRLVHLLDLVLRLSRRVCADDNPLGLVSAGYRKEAAKHIRSRYPSDRLLATVLDLDAIHSHAWIDNADTFAEAENLRSAGIARRFLIDWRIQAQCEGEISLVVKRPSTVVKIIAGEELAFTATGFHTLLRAGRRRRGLRVPAACRK
jgi:hypothetical protein